jgi:hypothetical protein
VAPASANIGGARKLFGDSIIGFMLFDHIRRRAVARVYGVTGEHANLVTVFAVTTTAGAVGSGVARVARARLSGGDAAIGGVLVKEAAHGVAGPWSREVPFFGLLTLAIVVTSTGPLVRGSIHASQRALHGVEAFSRRTWTWLGS